MLQDITKALIVAGLAFWLITNAFVYIVHVFSPDRAIVFSKFETADTDLGQQCPKILSSTFEQFRHPSPKGVTTHGLLDAPTLISVPEEARDRAATLSKQLEDIDLKIKDVDVPALVRSISSALSPPEYELKG